MLNELNNIFLDKVSMVVEEARKNLKTAVNIMMVYTYFEIGRMIVEEEQVPYIRVGKKYCVNYSAFLDKLSRGE